VGWFDANTWIQNHLEDGLPGWTVAPETNVVDPVFPTCIWSLLQKPLDDGLWTASVTLVLTMPTRKAPELIEEVVAVVDGWRPPGPAVDVELISGTSDIAVREDMTNFVFVFRIMWQEENN